MTQVVGAARCLRNSQRGERKKRRGLAGEEGGGMQLAARVDDGDWSFLS